MKAARREKLSVTIDPSLHRAIERHAIRTKVPKSQVVEDAIRVWERSRLAALAKEGYQRTKREDLANAEAYLASLGEIEEE